MNYYVRRVFKTKHNHHAVIIVNALGYRCGYVGINRNNSLYGKHYTDIDDMIWAHGEITFSGPDGYPIDLIYSDYWWFGFDCAHYDDLPDLDYIDDNLKEIYKIMYCNIKGYSRATMKTDRYCMRECYQLSHQLSDYE